MPTQNTIEVPAVDCNYHKPTEPCPGAKCPNGWHQMTAWMRVHCTTCGADATGKKTKRIDLGGKYYWTEGYKDCRPEMHRLWNRKPVRIPKQLGKKAKAKAKPLEHAQERLNHLGIPHDGYIFGEVMLSEKEKAQCTHRHVRACLDDKTEAVCLNCGQEFVECHGEAHSPAVGGMIDNCGCCAPMWGWVKKRA